MRLCRVHIQHLTILILKFTYSRNTAIGAFANKETPYVCSSGVLNIYGLIRYMWNVNNLLELFSEEGVRMGFANNKNLLPQKQN